MCPIFNFLDLFQLKSFFLCIMSRESLTGSRVASLTSVYIDRERYLSGSGVLGPHRRHIEESRAKLQRLDTLLQIYNKDAVEDVLLQLISEGDKEGIRKLLSEEKYWHSLNVHMKDLEGHTIITRTLMKEDEEILKILLEFYGDEINFQDAKLTCVRLDLEGMLDLILEFEKGREDRGGRKIPLKALKGKLRPEDDVPPFMMAAILGKYDFMEKLYTKDPFPILHLPSCRCPLCRETNTLQVEFALKRIHLLEALSNPIYNIFICQKNPKYDPVYEMFMLEKTVKQCLKEEPEYKDHYEEILESCSDLPIKLLELCRTFEEIQIFLSPVEGYEWYQRSKDIPYPRLAFAIDMDQREFVANANIQFVLHSEFVGHPWYTDGQCEELVKKFYIGVSVILFWLYTPYIWFAMICCLETPIAQYLLSPVNRCWSKLGSYIYFCVILVYLNGKDRSEEHIEPHVRYLRWIVFIYVISHLFSLLRQMTFTRLRFFSRGWNLYDLLTQLLFFLTFGVWLWDYEVHFQAPRPRKNLVFYDPLLIGECLFALATTFATLRIVRWYILIPRVGPLQTALGRMAKNLKTIFIYFAWTTLTFAVGTRILYRPYKHLKQGDNMQPTDMSDLESHFLTWFRIGKIGPKEVTLYTPKREVYDTYTGKMVEKENPPYTTQTFITLICIGFNVVAANFLRSTVVGLFGFTYKAVVMAKDVEWKYLRAQEWLYYLQDTTLAPPFNLLPHWLCIRRLFSKRDEEALSIAKERRTQYPLLLKKLFQRYLQKFREKHEKES